MEKLQGAGGDLNSGVLSKLYSFFKCAVLGRISHFQRKVSDFVVVPFSCR